MINAKTTCAAWTAMLICSSPLLAVRSEPNFEVTTLVEGLQDPIVLLPVPDGRLLVAEKGGDIKSIDLATHQVSIWTHIDVFTNAECGLVGLGLHPNFVQQPYVFAFATVSKSEQKIFRLRDQDGQGVEPIEIRGNIPTEGGIHNGGCLRIGPDGMLYFSVGDNGIPSNSQSMNTLAGKICRIALDGSVPSDNIFTTPTGAPRAIHALGFRNPFRFCIASDSRVFVMDVGSNAEQRREEINLVAPGANCGWPVFEGIVPEAPDQGFVNPIYAYADEGSAAAGCLIYEGTQFPQEYRGNLLHLDYTSNTLFRTVLDGAHVVSHTILVQDEGATVDLAMLPDGSLVYTQMFAGRVRQVTYHDPSSPSTTKPDGTASAATNDNPQSEATIASGPIPLCGPGLSMLLPLALMLPAVRRLRHRTTINSA